MVSSCYFDMRCLSAVCVGICKFTHQKGEENTVLYLPIVDVDVLLSSVNPKIAWMNTSSSSALLKDKVSIIHLLPNFFALWQVSSRVCCVTPIVVTEKTVTLPVMFLHLECDWRLRNTCQAARIWLALQSNVCIVHTHSAIGCSTCLQPIEGGIYTLFIHSCHIFLTIWGNWDFCTRHISNDPLIDLNENGSLSKWAVPTWFFYYFGSPLGDWFVICMTPLR